MAGLLDVAYTVLVVLVAVVGVGFVLGATDIGTGTRRWPRWLAIAFVAVFLVALAATLVAA